MKFPPKFSGTDIEMSRVILYDCLNNEQKNKGELNENSSVTFFRERLCKHNFVGHMIVLYNSYLK